MKARLKPAALLLVLALLLPLLSVSAVAEYGALPVIERRERPELEEKRLYFCSLLSGRAYMLNDTCCVSLRDMAGLYAIEAEVSVSGDSFTASAPGLELKGTKGSGYIEANGRYIYLPENYVLHAQDVYLPLEAMERIFGISIKESAERVDVDTAQCRLISGGEDYYHMNFSAEELYWLPRIAYVEAKDQPLAGLMGVCNVVLNRMASEDFPDTVFEVIYDNKYGVQFTPASTGSIQGKPDERSTIAACLVLEGYNVVDDSLYFVNPANNGNYWFREEREYVTTIGDHEFYK